MISNVNARTTETGASVDPDLVVDRTGPSVRSLWSRLCSDLHLARRAASQDEGTFL